MPDVGDLDPDPAARSSTVPWRPADHGPTVLSCDWGKRHTTGMNPQVAGHLAWISKASVGSVHGAKTITEAYSQPSPDAIAWSHVKGGDWKRRIASLVDGFE